MADDPAELPKVLIADDSRVVRMTLNRFLAGQCQVIESEDGEQAWAALQATPGISMVFTDIGMPNLDGYGLIQRIRASDNPIIAKMPVVVVTGADDSEGVKERVMELGATDLIKKPFDSAEVKSRARSYSTYSAQVSELEQHQATDPVTGLSTPEYFAEQGDKAVAFARRHGHEITVVRIDIDNFPALGAQVGRAILQKILVLVADVFKKNLRKEDNASWFGNERFALMLPGTDPEGADAALKRVRERTANINLRIGEKLVHVGFSIGIASQVVSTEEHHFSQILNHAEAALQQALQAGGGKTVRFGARAPAAAVEVTDVNIDSLLAQLAAGGAELTPSQVVSAVRKFLPLLAHADQRLKLGLSAVIPHLEKRLPGGRG